MSAYADDAAGLSEALARIGVELGARSVLVIVSTGKEYGFFVRGNKTSIRDIMKKHSDELIKKLA